MPQDAPDYSRGEWTIQSYPPSPPQAVRVEFRVDCPKLTPGEWVVFFPNPPTVAGQKAMGAEATLKKDNVERLAELVREIGGQGRTVLRLRFPAARSNRPHGFEVSATYLVQATMRGLVPGRPLKPAPPLAAAEKRLYTTRTPVLDWTSPAVARWMAKWDLKRKGGETPLAFAWRVTRGVRQTLPWEYDTKVPNQWKPAVMCQRGKGSGHSEVIATVLRATGIPARVLVGSFINGNGPIKRVIMSIAEFHDPQSGGWVPIQGHEAAIGDNPAVGFGKDDKSRILLHVDYDLMLDTQIVGIQHTDLLVGPAYWYAGATGSFKPVDEKVDWTAILDPPLDAGSRPGKGS